MYIHEHTNIPTDINTYQQRKGAKKPTMGKPKSGEELRAYRKSYNYRAEYFKKNRGLFGCIWFCSQCYRPLFGKKQVVIDHIVPLAKGGKNHVSNCTSICQKCNLDKKDKIDIRVVKGKMFKLLETMTSGSTNWLGSTVGLLFGLSVYTIHSAKSILFHRRGSHVNERGKRRNSGKGGNVLTLLSPIKGLFKLTTYPLRHGSMPSRLCFIGIYTLLVLYLLTTYTPLFIAWF